MPGCSPQRTTWLASPPGGSATTTPWSRPPGARPRPPARPGISVVTAATAGPAPATPSTSWAPGGRRRPCRTPASPAPAWPWTRRAACGWCCSPTPCTPGATPRPYRLCAGPFMEPLRPHGPDLDLAEPGDGMRRGHLDGLLQAAALEHVVPADDLLGLGERPVADQDLAVAHQHRLGLLGGPEAVAVQPDAARGHVVEPGKAAHVVGVTVLRRTRCRLFVAGEAARVDADQHHELHVISDPRFTITTNGNLAKDSPRAQTPGMGTTGR